MGDFGGRKDGLTEADGAQPSIDHFAALGMEHAAEASNEERGAHAIEDAHANSGSSAPFTSPPRLCGGMMAARQPGVPLPQNDEFSHAHLPCG